MVKKLLFSSLLLNLLLIIAGLFALHFLGGFKYVLYKVKNRGLAGEYEHRKQLFMNLPLEQGDIVFLGNSITAQCEWAEMLKNPKIKNRGIPGDTTDGILERLSSITQSRPSKIFLMIGINDLLFSSLDHIKNNLETIINRIAKESPSTELFVQSILPVNNQVRNTTISNEDIQKLNVFLGELADSKGLVYIDLYSKLLGSINSLDAKYTADGIHINGNAYILWKNEIQQYIN